MKKYLISIILTLICICETSQACHICELHLLSLYEDAILDYYDRKNKMKKVQKKYFLKGYLKALDDCKRVLLKCPAYHNLNKEK